ncbi:hypothetical protein GCM10009547_48600 [Sporichthya brevicatena]|uniref:Uncharacterized protein n=1 Tax=Sporichthya brevicatena TaxID=171442 RepID=A0ABP3SH17_9ACTN
MKPDNTTEICRCGHRDIEHDGSGYKPCRKMSCPCRRFADGTVPRCPVPGCPRRYKAGPDRYCVDHQRVSAPVALAGLEDEDGLWTFVPTRPND